MKAPERIAIDNYVMKTDSAAIPEMRQNSFTEKLAWPVRSSPQISSMMFVQTGRAIFLNTGYTFVGRAAIAQTLRNISFGDCFGRGFAAAFFHGIGNRLKLFKGEASAIEETSAEPLMFCTCWRDTLPPVREPPPCP